MFGVADLSCVRFVIIPSAFLHASERFVDVNTEIENIKAVVVKVNCLFPVYRFYSQKKSIHR